MLPYSLDPAPQSHPLDAHQAVRKRDAEESRGVHRGVLLGIALGACLWALLGGVLWLICH